MQVLRLDTKREVMEKLPDTAKMIVVVFHDKAPMRDEPDEIEEYDDEEETTVSPEAEDDEDAVTAYEPPVM